MRATTVFFLLLTTAGCGRTEAPANQAIPAAHPAHTVVATPAPSAASVPSGVSTPATPTEVVTAYYRRLAAHDYPGAWRLWGDGGRRSGHTLDAFTHGFADTASTDVTITGAVESEGAAGSIYATVPVHVEARGTGGERRSFTGTYVIRRVNDVPGATPEQLRWHIDRATLQPTG